MISSLLKVNTLPYLEERMKHNYTDFVLAGSKPTTNGLLNHYHNKLVKE
jgi:hypothetical protein